VRSDRRLLRRVLQNLLSNGIKYTLSGRVLLGVRRRGEGLSLLVCDTGPGIPESKRALVFKEFQRLQETASSVRGLGLGLSIVERIGKVLGHRVGLKSTPGRGSAFSVDLPRAQAATVARPPAPLPQSAGRIAGLSVLCIDNEPAVLDSMQALLEGWGCKVIVARNAQEACAAVEASAQLPDIVIADYHLDEGTGLEAVAAVRWAANAPVPVIVVTADYSAEVQREVRVAGYALLRKPIKAAALRALVYQLTWQRGPVAAE
jgi:CheY-like chemotaxis protein